MLPKMPERALFTAMSCMAPEGGGGPGSDGMYGIQALYAEGEEGRGGDPMGVGGERNTGRAPWDNNRSLAQHRW